MTIRIVPHGEQWKDAVEAFNWRMSQGGSEYGFYVHPVPLWGEKRRDDQPVWREYFLAVEDGRAVRGGFVLKPQQWWIRGSIHRVADWQGPYSEGAVSKQHGALALRIVRDMVRREPLLYSWGHGGEQQPIFQLASSLGWLLHPTPLLVHIVDGAAFARKNRYLRASRARCLALDLLAASGLATIGASALNVSMRVGSLSGFHSRAEEVHAFGLWTDAIWARAKNDYLATAIRDARAMNILAPPRQSHGEWSEPTRLRIRDRDERDVGWALVCLRRMKDHRRYGDLRVGSIVDAFGPSARAGEIVYAASTWLVRAGAEVVIANQSDSRWIRGFVRNAFIPVTAGRYFCAAPAFARALEPWEETQKSLFLTNMDGHGPMGL